MDECHFQQHGSRLGAWFSKEEKDPVLLHAPTRKKIGVIGAVKAKGGTLITSEAGVFNANTVEAFFDELIGHREKGKTMVIVLDNARFHHAKALAGWLGKRSKYFQLDFLSPYSPELNHIERVWKLVRRLCTHNQYFEALEDFHSVLDAKFSEWAVPNDTLSKLCAVI